MTEMFSCYFACKHNQGSLNAPLRLISVNLTVQTEALAHNTRLGHDLCPGANLLQSRTFGICGSLGVDGLHVTGGESRRL